MSDLFDKLVKQVSPEVAALAVRAKALILGVMPDAVEVVWPNQKIASYGIGPKLDFVHLGTDFS